MKVLLAVALCAMPALADCPAPPAAQHDIIADSYYDDPPVYSHIDPVKHAAYEAAVKPLEEYLSEVATIASPRMGVFNPPCAVRWLVAWAEADAMLGKIEKEQAHYERKWVLAGLALSYAKVRDAASGDQRASIDAWLKALAEGVRKHSDAYKGVRNNHYYWEGLAVGAVGAVTGDAKDLAWARQVFHAAEADIADDGTLPHEIKRGARALHYHLFSVAPLVMLESILDEHSVKLEKLVTFCIGHQYEPVAKRFGTDQIGVLTDDFDWNNVYFRHHLARTNSATNPPVKAFVTRLGGDLSSANPLEHVKK